MKNNPCKGETLQEFEQRVFTKDEIAEIDKKVKFHLALISLREKLGLTQRQMAEKTGMKQPMLARIESGKNSPKLKTVTKMLKPLGYSLAIVANDSKQIVHIFK